MATYAFSAIVGTIVGPGGTFSIGNGAGPSEEGVTVAMVEDKSTMTIGADGAVMHSLHSGNGGTVTVRLLKTSPTNQLLMNMYNLQTSNPAAHGQNVMSFTDTLRGDSVVCQQVAFKKAPDITYAKDGGTNEWTFDAGFVGITLGSGLAAGL